MKATNTPSWGIHGNGIQHNANRRRTQARQSNRPKEEKKKKFNPFFTAGSAITVQEEEKRMAMCFLNIDKKKEKDNEDTDKKMRWKPWLESLKLMGT